MADDRCYRITEADVEELRDRLEYAYAFPGKEHVETAAEWIRVLPELDRTLQELAVAFADMRLGKGTGLYEAQGLDDYASDEELAKLRLKDEKEDWRKISTDDLSRCYSSPRFFNSEGFVFHLPAFLLAELNDKHPYGFMDRLVSFPTHPEGWPELLTAIQRHALADVLTVVSRHPDHVESQGQFNRAIQELNKNQA